MPQQYPLVQGKIPGSWEEVRVAQALDYHNLPYRYQVPIRGGRRLRGGIVVDFVVSAPFDTPVEVFGGYWHEGQLAEDDKLKLAIEAQIFGRLAITIWDWQIPDQEAANRLIERLF